MAGGELAQGHHDHHGRADVEAQLPPEKVGHGAEDERPDDEADDAEGEEVGVVGHLGAHPVVVRDGRVVELARVVAPVDAGHLVCAGLEGKQEAAAHSQRMVYKPASKSSSKFIFSIHQAITWRYVTTCS